MYINQPPRWCPDAVPSIEGWRHPKTNELLVSTKIDSSLFEKKDEVLEQVKPEPAPQKEEIKQEEPAVEQPRKRGRPRAK